MGPDHDRTARTSHWAASSDPTRWQSSAHSSSAHPSPAPRLIAEGRVSRYACPLSLPAQSHTIPAAETHPSVPQQEHAQSSLGARCVDNRSIVDGPHASTSHPPLPPQRPRERTMPIIMLMPPMCARPPCPLRAATRPAAPRQSSPQEPATQFSTAPAARRRRQQRPVPADTPTSHIERGPLSVLDFSSSQCRHFSLSCCCRALAALQTLPHCRRGCGTSRPRHWGERLDQAGLSGRPRADINPRGTSHVASRSASGRARRRKTTQEARPHYLKRVIV